MTIAMYVGEQYAGQTVSWYYRDPATGELVLIGDYTVNAIGWITATGQQISHGNTAILTPAKASVAKASYEMTKTSVLPKTADSTTIPIICLIIVIASCMLVLSRKERNKHIQPKVHR